MAWVIECLLCGLAIPETNFDFAFLKYVNKHFDFYNVIQS